METILVINAGSSSVKFQLFELTASAGPRRLVKGQMAGIGTRPRLHAETHDGASLIEKSFSADEIASVAAATAAVGQWLQETQKFTPVAVGHRVVHGGPHYSRPTIVDRDVLDQLERYCSLAPLHQPNNLAPIHALLEHRPGLVQVACFDTAFHRTHDPVADHYALPERFYREGVRRYGFHGLSYEYIASRLRDVAPDLAKGKTIVAHLGSGASMCALGAGRSVDSTMGFTALDGLPMGTRAGQIDPGVILYMLTEKGLGAAEIQDLLYHDSGLKGMSGVSNDMRELEASTAAGAALAIDYFVYRIGLFAGMLAAALGGLDGFVFTAGIGENSVLIRARVAEKLAWLGAALDTAANQSGAVLISQPQSRVKLHVIPTDEELMIAQHTLSLLKVPA